MDEIKLKESFINLCSFKKYHNLEHNLHHWRIDIISHEDNDDNLKLILKIPYSEFKITDAESLWSGEYLYDLYSVAFTPWEWHKPIFDRCKELGIIGFSTPFDSSAVDFLEKLDVPCYKISSFENTDIPLIRKVASTGKPMIISTGMANISELDETVRCAREAGCKDLILLKCTSSYPASEEDSNILTIPHLRELFNCEVGLSDHTSGIGVAVASVVLGSSVIEKHFTLDSLDGGVDSSFSIEPLEMASLVLETGRAWKSQGMVSYGPTPSEKGSMQFRRSLYVVKDIKKGEPLSLDNVRAIRPGYGLAPKYMDMILGKKCSIDLPRGVSLKWDLIE